MENPKCIKGNNAISICVSGSCEKPNPFSCVQCVNSQCKAAHQDCIFLQWASFKTKLQKSQKLTNPDFINFSNTVEQTIRKSIQHLQKQLDNFYIWKSKFGLIPEAVALLKSIKENQQSAFTGKQISKILLNINIELPKFNEKELNIQVKQVLGKAGQLQKMIKQLYSFSVFNKKPVEEAICITKQEPKKLEILPSEQPIKIIKLPPPKPVQQISLKMKEKYLTNLNQKLSVLYEKPSHLELKVFYSDIVISVTNYKYIVVRSESQARVALQNIQIVNFSQLILDCIFYCLPSGNKYSLSYSMQIIYWEPSVLQLKYSSQGYFQFFDQGQITHYINKGIYYVLNKSLDVQRLFNSESPQIFDSSNQGIYIGLQKAVQTKTYNQGITYLLRSCIGVYELITYLVQIS